MRIEICQSYEALSLKAKEIVTSELGQHKALTLCAATGGSPTRMYELLVEEASRQPELFSQFTVLKLDEWEESRWTTRVRASRIYGTIS